ncbi:hypothetical protein : Uncharacterized protein OS=Cystobacter violaceus Cb vi76 GN=Q664_07235 PE=4 SV=1 [Gemmata massiliana]|uniref:Tetratricopeptide repeat protein n=1 Tax=Gemmata massiliana TaxID=1210884 RepID=A0A6P2CV13_9BACT|nr:hypothetical protein [Gemmata massiliana]VTR92417.1 hypothetical protein : Uncharacterized protein OS=Cystobacter violaceus Cb vi76 GN=Q664_07235 PE=4 SV=1 [Gemmata massiliana]
MRDDPLKERFPDLQPGKRPGSLSTVNGFGMGLVGRRDDDPETGTYVVTHVFRALFIPILAVGAYRVADAQGGGWYCLGKVPLSPFARVWNVVLALIVVGAIGDIWWNSHTHSPEYLAGQKLKQADEAAAAGHGGEAARLCREVMDSKTSKADEGRTKLAGFIENPPGAPTEAAPVYQIAADLQRENRCPVPDLFDKGTALATRHAADDPAAALALLEVIAAFAPDPAAELALRGDLLEKLLARHPDDPKIASRLATVYEEKGERQKCEKLLAPFENRLGTLDGAALLGRIHSAAGRFDKAHELLAPFVAARLPALREAEQSFKSAYSAAEDRVVATLKGGKAPGFDYGRYERAQKAEQQTMISAYIDDQLKDDASLRGARQKLMAERGVVGAVVDLGLVQLQRAQGMADPAARKTELEAAEKTFLSVRGFAGENNEYRLSLGQVYYWLGRPDEGKKLFDAILRGAKTTANLLMVAHVLREVGDTTAARKYAEEAFNQEVDGALKHAAAHSRAVQFTDLDDEILWLGRCAPTSREIQASLAQARGHRAERDGNDAAATDHYRQAVRIYSELPDNSATLNNSALAHFALFRVTLDRAEFTRGADKLDRSIALNPTSAVSLLNAASLVSDSAARDTVGKEVDFRALKSPPAWEVVAYLYRTPAERAAVADRIAKHPGFVKARAYAEKLLVLSPKRDDPYQVLSGLFEQTYDVAALKSLAARASKIEFDLGDDVRKYQEYLAGKDEAKKIEESRAYVTRTTEALTAARALDKRTFAVAVGRYVRAKSAAWLLGQPVDADELVKLADEAHTAAPSAGAESTLQTALTLRAHLALIRDDAGYAAMAKRTHRSFATSLVGYSLTVDGPHRAKALQNADVKRLAVMAEDDFRREPDRATANAWVFLKAIGSSLANQAGEKAKANELARARSELARATAPYSAGTAFDEYWNLLLAGKDADAKKVITALGAKGVPVP